MWWQKGQEAAPESPDDPVLTLRVMAGSGTTNRTISEIVQALFGVEAHKVVVVKMDSIYFSTSSYNEVVKGEEGNESEKPN